MALSIGKCFLARAMILGKARAMGPMSTNSSCRPCRHLQESIHSVDDTYLGSHRPHSHRVHIDSSATEVVKLIKRMEIDAGGWGVRGALSGVGGWILAYSMLVVPVGYSGGALTARLMEASGKSCCVCAESWT